MITEVQFQKELELIIKNGIREDIGEGDHSSLACIPKSELGKAKLLVKDSGIIAGVEFAKMIFNEVDSNLKIETFIPDGSLVKYGDVVFHVSGSSQSILKAERLVLNSMQRMSAIATKTNYFVNLLEGTSTKILDTRKTTPGLRAAEKWAVKIGGGENHRSQEPKEDSRRDVTIGTSRRDNCHSPAWRNTGSHVTGRPCCKNMQEHYQCLRKEKEGG